MIVWVGGAYNTLWFFVIVLSQYKEIYSFFLCSKQVADQKKKWRLHITIYSNIINYLKPVFAPFWNVGNRLITQNLLQCESTHQIKLFKVIYSYLSFNLKGGKCFVFLPIIKCFRFFFCIWVSFVIDWFYSWMKLVIL